MGVTSKNGYCFVLGNFPELAAAEIITLLNLRTDSYEFAPPFLFVRVDIGNPCELIARLGGTIKIAESAGLAKNEGDLQTIIASTLDKIDGKKIFGLSYYSDESDEERAGFTEQLGKNIKKELSARGGSARYVFNHEPILSSVTVEKNNLTKKGREFIIIKDDKQYSLWLTRSVQLFEDWGARDFGRPGRDDLSGMLPPKLARMMINLSGANIKSAILDPFCGSGTILTEAMVLGYKKIIGADVSEKAIRDSEKNISWLRERKPAIESEVKVFTADVSDLDKFIPSLSIDAVIAEPYLGKPLKGNEPREVLLAQADDLKKLYLNAFRKFKKILKPNGAVIFIVPRFNFRGDWITIDCQNEIEAIGFQTQKIFSPQKENRPFLLYARGGQRVGREIWKFTARP